ncbi:uncharacterized protein LOC127280487 [Leptopilina boulardi]|uniref:uncharacterized protein LOC127280487 n=1 Tax=Leptopilina boulardi TaxID=63433 RepID=UPI0021F677FE|nr:uncharacterized protein LOC127280487 [Leptopilina boulardi]
MNNTTIIVEQSQNFQFLSVCHYINLLGIIFHNKNYITFEQQSQPDIVVNTLIERLTKSKNETRMKSYILRELLKETDLYGGEKHEMLDMKYVNETFKYIINGVLFPNYSNINLYLAEMIQNSDNLNYSIFKKTVYNHLLQHHFNWEYCSQKNYTSTLPQLTIKKIFDDYIWSIFPQPEEDMSIMDVKYIYSMVGLNILRSTSSDEPNLSFSEYILISRELDLQHIDNETYKIVLSYYSTAALFFYASKGKGINKINLNDEFWREAYKILFTEIDIKMNEIVSKEIENSLPYKLERQINNTKTRTMIAREILLLYCYPSVHGDSSLYRAYIEGYVYLYKSTYLFLLKTFLQQRCKTSHFPDLKNVFLKQFPKLEKLYKEMIRNSISKVLIDGGLLEKMNPNVTVNSVKPILHTKCYTPCSIDMKINEDIHVIFAIIENKKKEYYAIRQVKDELTLITRNGNEKEFLSAIIDPKYLKLLKSDKEYFFELSPYKYKNENYKFFVERIANMKTKAFITNMTEVYNEEVLDEKISNIVKIFIPLYNCIESSIAGDISGATLSCSLDILSFLPVIGFFVSNSFKIVNGVGGSIIKNIFMTNAVAKTAGIVTKMSLSAALKAIAKDSVITIAKQILTKEFFKGLTIASLRTLDPGFELLHSMGRFSFKMLGKLVKNFELVFKTISQAKNFILSLKTLLMNMQRSIHLLTDIRGLVPKVLLKKNNYDIVRYHYPGGSRLFGPEYIRSIDTIAELRTVQGASYKVPVVPVKSSGEISYKEFVPEINSIIGPEMKMDNNDLLRRVKYMVADMVANGPEMKITRDYQVYPITIEWKIKPANEYDEKLVLQKASQPLSDESNLLEEINHNVQSQKGNLEVQKVPEIFEQYHHKKFSHEKRKNPNIMREDMENINQHLQKAEESLINIPKTSIHSVHEKPNTIIKAGDISNSFEYSTPQLQRLQEFADSIPGTSRQTFQIKPNLNIEKVEILSENYVHSSPYVKEILEQVKKNPYLNPDKRKLDTISGNIESIATHQHKKPKTLDLDDIPGTSKQNVHQNSNLNKKNVNTLSEGLENSAHLPVQRLLPNSGFKIKEFLLDPNFYEAMLKTPTYTDYVDLLKLCKYQRLSVMMKKESKMLNLRYALNNLARFQIDKRFPLKIPRKLYFTQELSDNELSNLLNKLKTKEFFFNDITILTNKESMIFEPSVISGTEVRYSITTTSAYGFVDLTKFHKDFENDYITFSDVLFTFKDISDSESNKILNIELEQKKISFNSWYHCLDLDLRQLYQLEENAQLSRMKEINNVAILLFKNNPLTSLKAVRNNLQEYILSTKPSLDVPSYHEFANEMINGKFTHSYQDWKINAHPHILDVLHKRYLDSISTVKEAEKRIKEIYGFTYLQNIDEAFSKYNKIKDIRQHLRFEDYYILYSYTQRGSLLNIGVQRRLDAAVNRLALRQSDTNRVNLMFHRAEMIDKDYASRLLEMEEKHSIRLNKHMIVFPDRESQLANCLSMKRSSSEIPLLMDIRLKNTAGLADVTSVISEGNPFYVISSRSDIILENIVYLDKIGDTEVMIMKMVDGGSSTEKRMVNIAKNLEQLYSTDTKFYSEFGN